LAQWWDEATRALYMAFFSGVSGNVVLPSDIRRTKRPVHLILNQIGAGSSGCRRQYENARHDRFRKVPVKQ